MVCKERILLPFHQIISCFPYQADQFKFVFYPTVERCLLNKYITSVTCGQERQMRHCLKYSISITKNISAAIIIELRFYQFKYAGETLGRQQLAEPQFNPAITGLSVCLICNFGVVWIHFYFISFYIYHTV